MAIIFNAKARRPGLIGRCCRPSGRYSLAAAVVFQFACIDKPDSLSRKEFEHVADQLHARITIKRIFLCFLDRLG